MQYRNLGITGEKTSVLGFGTMRLPTLKNHEDINKTEASKILKYGIDNGINIIDTAYSYHSLNSKKKEKVKHFLENFYQKIIIEKIFYYQQNHQVG